MLKRSFIVSEQSKDFLAKFFPEASYEDWNNWHWQLKNRFSNFKSLSKLINLSVDEMKFFTDKVKHLPLKITPYYASLIDNSKQDDPIRKSVVPVFQEYHVHAEEMVDPLGEEHDNPVPCIVHRYPDRVLFLTTNFCSTNCRYCTRSRLVNRPDNHLSNLEIHEKAIQYIKENTQIRDVLLSGGDPLTLPDERLNYLLSNIAKKEEMQKYLSELESGLFNIEQAMFAANFVD